MRPEVAAGERALEVREAARGWRRAGAIDETALARIEGAYADDRSRARLAFRVLFFVFAAFAVLAAFCLLLVNGFDRDETFGVAAFLFAVLCISLTEIQTGRMRRDRGGTEEATAFLAAVFLMLGAFWFVYEVLNLGDGAGAWTVVLALWTAILIAAAWRWAHLTAAAGAAVCAFCLLARVPGGRWLWVGAGLLAAAPLLSASVSARCPPSHRRACAAALVVTLLALYGAVSIWSLDHGLVERIGGRGPNLWTLFGGFNTAPIAETWPLWTLSRVGHALLTALVPLALIGAGIRMRRRILVDVGAILAALSLVTVRAYWRLADTWLLLALAGAALIAIALALQRRLDKAPAKELRGFTAEPLFVDPAHRHALNVAAVVATLSPAARRLPSEEPGVQGRGGASGGAGAGGEF